MNPYQVTRDFEHALCEYTGAPFAVAVNSCTAALQLAIEWNTKTITIGNRICPKCGFYFTRPEIEIPKHTYVSVPCAIIHAGAHPTFRDENWSGSYQLKPLPVWDCARRFTSNMFNTHIINDLRQPLYYGGMFLCVSFSTTKILGSEQGGAILHDSPEADQWFRLMRFDGRTENIDQRSDHFTLPGHHFIMLPSTAATLTIKLYHLPRDNPDLPHYPYPDLSKHPAFR